MCLCQGDLFTLIQNEGVEKATSLGPTLTRHTHVHLMAFAQCVTLGPHKITVKGLRKSKAKLNAGCVPLKPQNKSYPQERPNATQIAQMFDLVRSDKGPWDPFQVSGFFVMRSLKGGGHVRLDAYIF